MCTPAWRMCSRVHGSQCHRGQMFRTQICTNSYRSLDHATYRAERHLFWLSHIMTLLAMTTAAMRLWAKCVRHSAISRFDISPLYRHTHRPFDFITSLCSKWKRLDMFRLVKYYCWVLLLLSIAHMFVGSTSRWRRLDSRPTHGVIKYSCGLHFTETQCYKNLSAKVLSVATYRVHYCDIGRDKSGKFIHRLPRNIKK